MSKIDEACAWALAIANDAAHGYDQGNRWGPDYDCSALVISDWEQAGVPVKSRGATYTGNMRGVFLSCGFEDVTGGVDLGTGAGLQKGDVLLNIQSHTALYMGNGQLVQASGNELGGITGGQTGDQTGREINISGYYNFPWDCVLRYAKEDGNSYSDVQGAVYTVQQGDSLWGIAERCLGDGSRYGEIMAVNGLTDTLIHPGQALRLPRTDRVTVTLTLPRDVWAAVEEKAEARDMSPEALAAELLEEQV